MYIHTPFPNNVYAIDLNDTRKILLQYKPKQNPAARAVACCDVVSRGVAYVPVGDHGPAKIFLNQLDGQVVALNAKTGEEIWKMENSDIAMGSGRENSWLLCRFKEPTCVRGGLDRRVRRRKGPKRKVP